MEKVFWKRHLTRRILVAAVLLATCSAGLVLNRRQAAVETGAWGLSFPQEGAAPVATVEQAQLARYDGAYVGDPDEPVIYLTFDAGYEAGYTEQILDVLAEHNVPAAFFLVGNYLETAPELVCRMVQEGHTVGNHTYHHPDMSAISDEAAFAAELESLETAFQELTGQELPRYYRPPRGEFSQENLEMAQALGYRTVFWSLAYVDWLADDQPTDQEAFDKLIPRIHNGAVVLLHSTSETNARILGELLTRWEELGYTFGSLDDLFAA